MATITELGLRGSSNRKTIHISVKKETYDKLMKFLEDNSINKSKWLTKLIEEKMQ